MTLPLRNNNIIKLIFILVPALLATACLVWVARQSVWTTWDFQILDAYFQRAVRLGHGADLSPDILYVMITDESYESPDNKILNRTVMAEVNAALAAHGAKAVAYDIIFSRPSRPADDRRFAQSLAQLDSVYLPIALDSTSRQRRFKWEVGAAYDRLRTDYVKVPQQTGKAQPLYASRAVMQIDDFVQAVPYTGHISAASDADGVYRHLPVLIKVGSGYVPTLALAIFLQQTGIPFQAVSVDWGHAITIPA
ncbi:MAG: CHASE2 domain-containing protein, partial [Candidatus Tectomicrobia bacterium]|nr:CHASE2 domain-containing protein [Candidatus Tectomicrobia bacterium]